MLTFKEGDLEMKTILILTISILILVTNLSLAQTQIDSGYVYGTWDVAGSPYLINGEISIPYSMTLTIEPGVLVDILVAHEDIVKEKPEELKALMRAWLRAIEYWKQNPDEANAIMAKQYDMPVDEFAEVISGVKWPTYQESVDYLGTEQKPGRIYEVSDVFADVFLELGTIKQKPDMAKAIDDSFPAGERTDPTGGFFIWWQSENKDFVSKKFMEEFAIPNDILYVPGGAFYPIVGHKLGDNGTELIPSKPEQNTMRLGFSYREPEIISEGIERLGKLLSEHL